MSLGKEDSMDISVVMCRVRESGNVGSACRAMKTMGIARLLLANCPEYEEEKVRMMAVHARDVYENARRFATLEDALAEFPLSAGFTRRMGEKRKESSAALRDFVGRVSMLAPAPLALVFGNEKDGLSDSELDLCSLAVHIPSSEACPSLNIAQAVQVACYEFFITASLATPILRASDKPRALTAPRLLIDENVSEIAGALLGLGFFRKSDDSHLRRFLREFCERASASPAEVDYLKRIFLKTAALALKHPSDRT
jgi:TrmH family RNA methyltransferase